MGITSIYGNPDRFEVEGSHTPVTVTVDGVDNTRARLWTTTASSMTIWDGVNGPVEVDSITKSLKTIDVVHAEVHEGEMFTVDHRFPAVANSGTAGILIGVGATKSFHLVGVFTGAGDAIVQILEGPTLTASGASITAYNMNRTSSDVTTGSMFMDSTSSSDGSEIFQGCLFGGAAGRSVGGTIRANTERILALDTNYEFRITNIAGQAKDFCIELQWYEE